MRAPHSTIARAGRPAVLAYRGSSMFDLRRKATIAAAALVFAAAAAPVSAAQFNAAQKNEIESIVHSYLLKNPEILREMATALDKKQRAEQASLRRKAIATHKKELYDSSFQAVVGNPNGKINLVEFFDYNCIHCRRALGDVLGVIKAEPNLRVVLKDFPILGSDSVQAAEVASAVRMQISGQKFFEYHQKLLESRGRVGKQRALDVAQEMGLDMDKLKKDLNDPSIRAGLLSVAKLADALNINGTPSFVLGDQALEGEGHEADMKRMINSLAKCGKTEC